MSLLAAGVGSITVIAQLIGFDGALLVCFVYQLFMPENIHPQGGTKLQRLLLRPNPTVVTSLEAIAEEVDGIDDYKIKVQFSDGIQTEELKDPSQLRNGETDE